MQSLEEMLSSVCYMQEDFCKEVLGMWKTTNLESLLSFAKDSLHFEHVFTKNKEVKYSGNQNVLCGYKH